MRKETRAGVKTDVFYMKVESTLFCNKVLFYLRNDMFNVKHTS